MKRITVYTMTALLMLLAATAAFGQEPQGAPNNINVQGKLAASGGGAVTAGNYTFAFKIFDASAGGAQIWPATGSENHLLALGTDGLWNATLGKDGGLNVGTMDDTTRWLEVTVTPPAGSPETFPRVKLTSNPFTLEAGQLNGKTGAEYVEVAGDKMTGVLEFDFDNDATIDAHLRQDPGPVNLFRLFQNGNLRCDLVGADKGHLALLDNSGDATAILDASPAGGGFLDLRREDGTLGTYLRGGNTSDGATLEMRNAAGTTTINLDADAATSYINSDKVGIGTASPTKKLEVAGSIKVGTNDTVFSSNISSNSPLNLQAPAGIVRVYVDDISGNMGVGTTAPEARVTSNYSAAFAGSDVAAFLGSAENTSSGQAYGGYFNVSSSGTGTHYGLRSAVAASSGTASAYGLLAENNATTATIHYGIVGHATGGGPVQNRGVTGFASGATGLNIGIRGDASGTGAYAGSFENAKVRVGATGTENIVDGNGDLYVQDEMEVDGVAAFANGTTASPALTFSGDLNTGIYQPGLDALGLSTGGVERVRVNSFGDVGVGTTSPGSRMHVFEDINSPTVLTIQNPNTGTASGQRLQFDSEDGSGTGSGAFIAVFDNTSTAPNVMRIANNLTAGDIDFLTSGNVRLIVESGGNVAIGTTAPAEGRLDVNRSGAQVVNVNRTTNDGILINFEQDDAFVGDISVAGAIVSYNAFTGSHYGWTEQSIERGTLMTMTGVNRNLHDTPGSEVIYGIASSAQANDPACLGSYLGLQEPNQPDENENPHLVMAVGNGDMWVTDEAGNIQPGDYLISSSTPGHAMKDDPEKYPLGYIVARAAEAVNWASVSERIGGTKHKRISVLFESFVRTSTTQLTKVVEQQQKEIEELKTLVKRLMAKEHPEGKLLGELE